MRLNCSLIRFITMLAFTILGSFSAFGQSGDDYSVGGYVVTATEPLRPMAAVRGDGGIEIFFSEYDSVTYQPDGDSYIRRYYQNTAKSIPYVDSPLTPRCNGCFNAFAGPAGLVVNSKGLIELFGEEGYLGVVHRTQTALGTWTSESIGAPNNGRVFSDPWPVVNSDGTFEVFAIGGDQAIWHVKQAAPGGTWGTWSSLGGLTYWDKSYNPASKPEWGFMHPIAIRNSDGRLEVFILGIDRAIWHIKQTTPGGAWGTWVSMGGSNLFWPTVTMNADGRLEVFAIGGDQAVWHISQTSVGGSWSQWSSLGGTLFYIPAAVKNLDGTLEIFSQGQDGSIWRTKQLHAGGSTGWSSWTSIGGRLRGSPTAVVNKDGTVTVISVGSIDLQMWTKTQQTPGGSWNCWTRTDGRLGSC